MTTRSSLDPPWYKDAIIYETHVKAFFDGNGDGIGDFEGLTDKLDYLETLGRHLPLAAPLLPLPAPRRRLRHRRLLRACTPATERWTTSGCSSRRPIAGTSPCWSSWWSTTPPTSTPGSSGRGGRHPARPSATTTSGATTDRKYAGARIIFTDTERSNWTWDPEAKAFYWHRFFSHQPDLNFDNPRVLEELEKVMRFWLDMGVDGFRLDAIPYLVEREGTTCENLPETHAVIRRLRAYVDRHAPGCLLLAEANQWPEDVRPYFGDGDECHMAFHFPVMPRIFMALRLESAEPIVDILRRTPPIPPSCQWGLFLRNHDELTLEMVSEDERAYLNLAYARDPRARLNVGIRRRLAPLVENGRRRIELLNGLLFSLPGTPIVYYGDEIGMGDDTQRPDRDGVRTPMQWNGDPSAGFSSAPPERLYSHPITDSVYGAAAVNVEAQVRDRSSLLQWMRNMIRLRKQFRVFGRGSIEFLPVANRKILAFVRRWESDTILCVANLSRHAQPAELDLSAFRGVTPVEMLGYTPFPSIGELPYFLTLGGYGFYWFELQHGA